MSLTSGSFQSWVPDPLFQWVGHDLGLNDSVTRVIEWVRNSESLLSIVDDFSDFFVRQVTDNLVLVDAVQAYVEHTASASSTISFSHSFTFTGGSPDTLSFGAPIVIASLPIIDTEQHSHVHLFNITGSVVNVDFITGGTDGQLLCLQRALGSVSNTRVRKNMGNILGGANRLLDNQNDVLVLVKDGISWYEVSFQG